MIDMAALVCMGMTIFNEARGEPLQGQIAVGYVLYRRAKFDQKNICSETYKPKQFTWTSKKLRIPSYVELRPYTDLAYLIITQKEIDYSYGANYFHHVSLGNKWGYKPKTVIANHVFY